MDGKPLTLFEPLTDLFQPALALLPEGWVGDTILVFVWIFLFWLANQILILVGWLKDDPTGRYFTLHVICNLIVTIVYLDDVFYSYWYPSTAYIGPTDRSGVIVIAALHITHTLFWWPLNSVDLNHHVVMVFVMLPVAVALNPGYLLGHGAFFSSGLPGGIDYLMLVCVKKGWMKSITEKRYNSTIQLWIRAPGCVYHTLLSWICYVEGSRSLELGTNPWVGYLPDFLTLPGTLLVMATFYWNGLYFGGRVLRNVGAKEYELAQKKAKQS